MPAVDEKGDAKPWLARLRVPDRFFPALPIAIATVVLAWRTLRTLLAVVGEPCGALDDSFIHFQYARAIAELHPLKYQAGEPATSGATSLLWPAMLAPFHAIGFRGMAILWPAWAFGFAALGALSYEAFHLAKPLAGKSGAAASAAMVLCFSAFTWCAASGMEVVPFAWAIARCVRRASEWVEDPSLRTPKRRAELIALAFGAALLRPEGAVFALALALVLGVWSTGPKRAWALAAAAGAFATPAILWLCTGSARANTAIAKLLVGNPYYSGHVFWDTAAANLRTLFGTILNGQVWSTEFLPTNALPVVVMALAALPIAGIQKGRLFRAIGILLIALGMCIPCFYVTFLWNRLRYLWPFATGFLLGLSCLAAVLGDIATAIHPRAKIGVPIFLGFFAGAFAVRIDWVIDDVANSARGIDHQHVKIGRWAKDNLPADARIGVNDTGAIAYFSDRHTFDIVGLTTNGEARYWVAGVASRLEHYERLHRDKPDVLPTHFIVYPEWMGTDALFGKQLFDATVTDSTILGGQSMRAYVADWSLLDSGAKPWSTGIEIVDDIDVADLESEAEHHYDLLGAHDNEEIVGDAFAPTGERVLDGGRGYRHADSFVAHLKGACRGIARVAAKTNTTIEVRVAGRLLTAFAIHEAELLAPEWTEIAFEVPADIASARTPIDVTTREGTQFSSFHYWFGNPRE